MDISTDRAAGGRGQKRHGRRVVVGVDGSPGSRTALAYALTAAARRGLPVEVVSTFSLNLYWLDFYAVELPNTDAVRADIEAKVRALVEEVRGDPELARTAGVASTPVAVTVTVGPTAEQLLRVAADAELLVVGSRGRGTVRSALLGSVALHCVSHARVPVVVAHPAAAHSVTDRPRVVVGVDGSDRSREAFLHGVREAARLGADVEVVAAYQLLDYWTDGYVGVLPTDAQLAEKTRTTSEQWVTAALAGLAERGAARLPTVRTVALPGAAADVLIERSRSAELLVVGSRGHGEIAGLVLGSVALNCAMHAQCPVLVVHPRAGRSAGLRNQDRESGG